MPDDEAPTETPRPSFILDDDARILDALIEQEAEPPETASLPRGAIRPRIRRLTPPMKSLITRTFMMPSRTPFLIAAANPYRKSVRLDVSSSSSTGSLIVADNATDVQSNADGAGTYYSAESDLLLDYNGELWACWNDSESVTIKLGVIIISEIPQSHTN